MPSRAAVVSSVAGLTLAAVLVALAWRFGGYFPAGHLGPFAIAVAVAGVLIVVRPPRLSGPAAVALGCLLGLTVWTALSATWAPSEAAAVEDVQRDLGYAGLLVLALLVAGSGRYSRALPWLALAVIGAVCTAALISRLYPGWIFDAPTTDPIGGYRLAYPLGYWNGLGALAAMGAVLGAGLAADRRSPPVARGIATAASVALVVCLYLSLSRGAWIAVIAGVLVLVALGARRAGLATTLLIIGVASMILLGRLQGLDALVEDPGAGSAQADAGRTFGPTLLLVCGIAGVVQGVLAASGRTLTGSELRRVLRTPVIAVAAVVAVVGATAIYVAAPASTESRSAEAIEDVERWVQTQWDEFQTATTPTGEGTDRLSSARTTRSAIYGTAWDAFAARPLQGDGAGGFETRWAHDRELGERVRDAHSLYYETAAELGLPGLALLLGLIGAVVWSAVRARVRPGGLGRSQTAAAAAAFAVWIVHAGIDWDWQLPVVTGTALILAAALLPEGRGRRAAATERAPDAAASHGSWRRPRPGRPG